MSEALRVSAYRFRRTWQGRWRGYFAIVLLVGLVGGLAMGAIAGARRTQSSFPIFLASTNPSNLRVGTALYDPALGFTTGYNASLVRVIQHLPFVQRAKSYAGLNANPLGTNGAPTAASKSVTIIDLGSVNGLFFNQDRVTVVRGRMANPKKVNEIMMSQRAASELNLRVGETVAWGFAANSSAATSSKPLYRLNLTLVGTVVLNSAVVQDDVDVNSSQPVIFTPALTSRMIKCCTNFSFTFLRLDGGSTHVPAVEDEIQRVVPPVLPYDFYDTSNDVTKAQVAIRPETIALEVFGGIAALAALLIAMQLIARQLSSTSGDEGVMRSIGADPRMIVSDGSLGILVAVVLGAFVAGAVAVALSPLTPLGPVRPIDPYPGVAFDWTVLGIGMVALAIVLGGFTVAFAARSTPHRTQSRWRPPRHASRVADAASAAGLPVPAVIGVRFALESGSDAAAAPVRSTILGTTIATVVVIATVIFGSSIGTLVSHPALYGWNWTFELAGGGGAGNIPAQKAAVLLDHSPQVSAWSGYYFGNVEIDGRTVPALGGAVHAPVAPPILVGHGLDAANQIVLGPGTLAQLHKTVGEWVTVSYGASHSRLLRIVGTATMPATGVGGVTGHPSMGTGALVQYLLFPAPVRNQFGNSPTGPNAIFVRLHSEASPLAARAALDRIASALTLPTNYGVALMGVQRPAQIVNYRSASGTAALLSLGLALGAIAALGLTLFASVRRRRRDLALLKVFGFTGRQLASTVAWQASCAVTFGTIVGVPLGIFAGHVLWVLFARAIFAVPRVTVPVWTIVFFALGAVALANLVAVLPARIARKTSAALLLRSQ
ncbi:MAG TPA: ABC transporter permease [Acidimicrobiales bacterium]|nr:ABC transporter permease [Acidimicrobiales bacterium]